MSGHSKWHQIKHQKGAADAKRGNLFTKHAKLIAVAARHGGDPEMNPSLRLAVDNAREDNMPKANIERAIKRGTGELKEGGQIDEVFYEGYGPGGVAIYVHALTDNRNRTVSEVRTLFERNGGHLGQAGSIAWMFERKGNITVNLSDNPGKTADDIELAAIDAGADDVNGDGVDGHVSIATKPHELDKVKKGLEAAGLKLSGAALTLVPKENIQITDVATAGKILKLLEALEADDDVNEVTSNFDIPEEVLKQAEQ